MSQSLKKITGRKVVKVLTTPKTAKQICFELGLESGTTDDIRQLPLPKGYYLFEQIDSYGTPIFMVFEKEKHLDLPKRIWHIWTAEDQPYVWIQFPSNLNLDRLKIVPLSDGHYGAKGHDTARFIEYIQWIEREPDVFCFLNGDIIENAIDGSIGGAVYESSLTPSEQIWGSKDKGDPGIIELLRPIRHKIMWALPGNHEDRTRKKTDIDPLRIICRELDIPYFDEPIYADVLAWGKRFTFFCQHGKTGAGTKGGKLNAASRPAEFQEAVGFIIMGHVHDSMANPTTRMVREREFDEKGQLISFRLVERPQYTVICPSFYKYFKTYGARAGYAPGSWGTVTCTLYRDGGYRASE